jgi:hypothetical protein
MIWWHRFGWAGLPVALAAGLVLSGCGTPGAPQPPSLNLPERVADLAATRAGNQVSLTWTMPKKNTDKLLLKGNVPVRICRKEGAGACEPAGAAPSRASDLLLAPGAAGAFTDSLPAALASGAPRAVAYFVELNNRNGRSAGLSNAAVALAGEAPAPVTGLVAQVRKDGVVLRWTPESGTDAIRLHRTLLTPEPAAKPTQQQGLLTVQPEPVEQSLLVETGEQAGRAPNRTLDKNIRFGQVYEYRAQRVARVTVDGRALELAGPISEPVRVEVLDVFPPEVPTGLAAVATAAGAGAEASIDLSWQPGTEADLAGYAVYRREGDNAWQRISPAEPLIAPAFRDGHVQPGHTYRYVVSAIDQGGHESARSAEAEETAPNP